MRPAWLILAVAMGLALQAAPASAGLTYTLNCSVNPCSGAVNDYGTVELTPGSTGHVVVTVSLAANEKFADLTNGYAILWDIAGSPDLTIAAQGANAGHFAAQNGGAPSLYLASPFAHNNNNCSGQNATSCFDYAVAHKNDSGADSILVFDVTSSTGLALSNFVATSEGFSFAAMIFQSGTGTPFYVASNGTPIPEPPSWTVSVAGMMGLVLLTLGRRRRQVRLLPMKIKPLPRSRADQPMVKPSGLQE